MISGTVAACVVPATSASVDGQLDEMSAWRRAALADLARIGGGSRKPRRRKRFD